MVAISKYCIIWTSFTFKKTALRATQETKPSIFSRGSDRSWSPRFCDLTPCDFLLCGHVKGKVYAIRPMSVRDLKVVVREAIEDIQQPICDLAREKPFPLNIKITSLIGKPHETETLL